MTQNHLSTESSNAPSSDNDVVTIGEFVTCYLAASAADNGAYALIEHTLGPGLIGAPPHRHTREDECSYVLEGTLTVWREGVVTVAGPGGVIAKPRGEWHTFWNAEQEPVRFLEVIAPGAFAGYFRELGALFAAAAGELPDVAAIVGTAAHYGLEFDFAAVGPLIREHGLRLG